MKRSEIQQELESARRELARLKYGRINTNFVQVSKQYIDEMTDLAGRAPSAHKTLWCLIKSMDKQNAVMVSQESLGKLTGLSQATIKRAVSTLRTERWIETIKVGTANAYRVNSAVVWQARANEKWASFNARVIANFDEQDELTKAGIRTKHIPLVEQDDDVMVLQDANSPPPDQPQLDFHSREKNE